ncbi:MAG: LTA synthase family protein [Proteobacteria bacterium]|nr:LTA synthase family protein [Pseudomonadota bacterium]
MHITPDFLRTYLLSQGVPDSLWDLLASDAGGANLSLCLLSVPVIFLVCWFIFGKRIPQPEGLKKPKVFLSIFGVLIIGFVFLPCLFRSELFAWKTIQAKVAPPVVLIRDTIVSWNDAVHFPENMSGPIARVQKAWLEQETDKNWQMLDDKHPFLRKYVGECKQPDKKYNVVIISFESYRAYNLNLFNTDYKQEVTPYLNSLIHSGDAAYYTRYFTNGHPTIGAFMALHTGIPAHSRYTVAKSFVQNKIDSFVNVLRHHGYETVFVGASDPDWDSQRPWLMQWYDDVLFDPANDEMDRAVMRDARKWIQERDASKPFLMTAFLMSNHMPFNRYEPEFRLTDSGEIHEKIINTMHYDDDVLREFIESMRDEPWFENTLFIVTGDHGVDLGERGEQPDYKNLRTEAVWIPLVIYGKHPRLPRGKQDILASHSDLGMTVLDLLGICDPTTSMGHSLLTKNRDTAEVYIYKYGRAVIRTNTWSEYILSYDKENDLMLYKGEDLMQNTDVSKEYPEIADELYKKSHETSLVIDYGYHNDLYNIQPAVDR